MTTLVRILEYLDSHGLAQNTLVVYSSDQGFFTGEHGWNDKRWMYEQSLSMPLLMRWLCYQAWCSYRADGSEYRLRPNLS